jgi:hypothetical protein
MANVDLSELIPDLAISLTAPGQADFYDAVSDDEWISRLKTAFWMAYNDGLISGFTCNEDGVVSPLTGSATFGRDLQQIVIFYCGLHKVQNDLMQIKTRFKAKAGPVEYETEQSAGVLKALLDSLLKQRDDILERLSALNGVSTIYVDSIRQRDYAMRDGLMDFWTN